MRKSCVVHGCVGGRIRGRPSAGGTGRPRPRGPARAPFPELTAPRARDGERLPPLPAASGEGAPNRSTAGRTMPAGAAGGAVRIWTAPSRSGRPPPGRTRMIRKRRCPVFGFWSAVAPVRSREEAASLPALLEICGRDGTAVGAERSPSVGWGFRADGIALVCARDLPRCVGLLCAGASRPAGTAALFAAQALPFDGGQRRFARRGGRPRLMSAGDAAGLPARSGGLPRCVGCLPADAAAPRGEPPPAVRGPPSAIPPHPARMGGLACSPPCAAAPRPAGAAVFLDFRPRRRSSGLPGKRRSSACRVAVAAPPPRLHAQTVCFGTARNRLRSAPACASAPGARGGLHAAEACRRCGDPAPLARAAVAPPLPGTVRSGTSSARSSRRRPARAGNGSDRPVLLASLPPPPAARRTPFR